MVGPGDVEKPRGAVPAFLRRQRVIGDVGEDMIFDQFDHQPVGCAAHGGHELQDLSTPRLGLKRPFVGTVRLRRSRSS